MADKLREYFRLDTQQQFHDFIVKDYSENAKTNEKMKEMEKNWKTEWCSGWAIFQRPEDQKKRCLDALVEAKKTVCQTKLDFDYCEEFRTTTSSPKTTIIVLIAVGILALLAIATIFVIVRRRRRQQKNPAFPMLGAPVAAPYPAQNQMMPQQQTMATTGFTTTTGATTGTGK